METYPKENSSQHLLVPLWFECEMSPAGSVFEHPAPSWHCLRRLKNLQALGEADHWRGPQAFTA